MSESSTTGIESDGVASTPTLVFALAVPTPEPRGVAYEVHRVGTVDCVLAYSSRQRLAECCGEYQPWAAVDFADLVADLHAKNLAGPVLDAVLEPAAWWTSDGPPVGAVLTTRTCHV